MTVFYNHKILITSAGGFLGHQNIEYLRKTFKKKIWILSSDSRAIDSSYLLSDRNIILPKGDSANYIPEIIKQIIKFKINFVLPCSDEEALKLSNNIKKFRNLNVRIACQLPSVNRIISNKIKTYEFLKENDIPVPEFRVARSKLEIIRLVDHFYNNYEGAVIKEPRARGNRGTIVIAKNIRGCKIYNESRELHMSLSYFKKYKNKLIKPGFPKLLCERLFSPCYDLDVLSENGKYIYSVIRQRINSAGVPFRGNIIRKSKKLEGLAEKLVNLLGLSWLVDIDVMTKSNGEPAVIEINPRASGSCVVSVIAGIPLYKLLLDSKTKKNIQNIVYPQDGLTVLPKIICETIKKNEKK